MTTGIEILPPEMFKLVFSYMKGQYDPFWNLNSRINQMILQENYWLYQPGDILDHKIKQGYINILDTTKMFHLRKPKDLIHDRDAIKLKESCNNCYIDTLVLHTPTLFLLSVSCNRILIRGCNPSWAQSWDMEQHIQSLYMYKFFKKQVKHANYIAVYLSHMGATRVFSHKVLRNVKFYLNRQDITQDIIKAILTVPVSIDPELCFYLVRMCGDTIMAMNVI